MMIRGPFPALLLCFAALCCNRPPSEENFVRADEACRGVYAFPADMSDSLCTYTLLFYTKVDNVRDSLEIPLRVELISPSGQKYSEDVSMKAGRSRGDRQVYRSSVTPVEYGPWQVRLSPLIEIKGLRGLGLIVERDN